MSGVVSFLFGVLMLARPLAGALAVAGLIGAYAIIAGIALVTFGVQVRAIKQKGERLVATFLPERKAAERTRR